MENIVTVLISTILSGAFATFVTLWWQNKSSVRQQKLRIFTILMAKRYEITAEECVEALNMIDVVFYKDPKVRSAWKEFRNATDMPESEAKAQIVTDKRLKMLEVMAENIGYKDIRWDDINQYYFPVGLSERKRDEAILRKVQIDAGIAQLKKQQEHEETSQVEPQADFNNQMLLKVLENPDGFLKLFEFAEKTQKNGKNGKIRK